MRDARRRLWAAWRPLLKVSPYFFLAACTVPEAEPPRPQALRVVEVRQGPLEEVVPYVGTVHPAREVQVSARVAGTVAERALPEGSPVGQGEAVLTLHAPDLEARSARARAERDRAAVERSHQCDRWEVDLRLAATGDLSATQLDASRAACEGATAAAAAAEAAVAEVRVALSWTEERSPMVGTVLQRHVDPGQVVHPGQPLVTLGSEGLEVRLQLTEEELRRGVGVGTPVILRDLEDHPAAIATISPQARGRAPTFEARIPLPDVRLAPGSTVLVDLVVDRVDEAVAVPREALGSRQGEAYVLVVEEGLATAVPVRPGVRQGGWVAVSGDLGAGAWVAVGDLSTVDLSRPVLAIAEARP